MEKKVFTKDELMDFGYRILRKTGMRDEYAKIVIEILVDANLRGIDTHGIYLLNLYAKRLKKGLMNPDPDIKFEKLRSSIGILDGDYGLGQIAAYKAMEKAIEMARETGVGSVLVKNSNHFGAAAYYTEYAAKKDMIGIIFSHGESDVVLYGSNKPFLGTSPISIGIPAGEMPYFIMDMATSEVAFGKVRAAAELGKSIPPNWAVDKEGNPVTDPTKANAVVPMSGAKGYALGLAIEIFCSMLTGMPYGPNIVRKFDDWENKSKLGHYVQAIDISAILPVDEFKRRIDELFRDIKSQPTAPGFKEVMIPGEPEERKKKERLSKGINLPDNDINALKELAELFNEKFI